MRSLISSSAYKERHLIGLGSFSRERKLSFKRMIALQLSKSIKSLQVRLNEALFLTQGFTVTASAYSQARQKYRHTAFIELSDFTRDYYYKYGNLKRWRGLRVNAIDGSLLALPNHPETIEHFGTRPIPATSQQPAQALAMCRLMGSYDVLNQVIHRVSLAGCNSYEVKEAQGLLDDFDKDDVVLFDRHYASYEFIARLTHQGCHFVIRCPRSTFREGNAVFEGGSWTKSATLTVPAGKKKVFELWGLPTAVSVRFVRVILSNGETELLVTSLDDKQLKPNDFHYLYGLRWGIETLYGLLKTRLNLENFSGYCLESVKQDIFASIFITNMESLLTCSVQEELKARSEGCRYEKQVNKVISFNAIKHQVYHLLFDMDIPIDDLLEKLMTLFITNPTLIKPNRVFRRDKSGPSRRLRHHKSKHKMCF